MPRRKKKFIDKKNAVTYHLIHRSQKDPLQADADASERVLVTGDELAQANRRERLTELGIYYDDDYDYEQHLRDVDDMNKMEPDKEIELFRVGATASSKSVLPKEALPSATEEKIGMLELAAPVSGPRLDWDPDIVALLDSDNEEAMEDDLDDYFIALANKSGGEDEGEGSEATDRQRQWIQEQYRGASHDLDNEMYEAGEEDSEAGSQSDEFSSNFDEEDEVGSLQSFSDGEGAKTRFTNYSMSSSIMRRNEGLTLVDDKFEQLYAEYDDDEIGALDHEDIDGKVSTTGPMMEFLLQRYEKDKQSEGKGFDEHVDMKEHINLNSSEDESEEELVKVVVDEGNTNKWDCESILSTYSNLYNHPTVIETPSTKKKKSQKIELTKKLGIPVESIQPTGLTKKQLQALDRQNDGPSKVNITRKKGETPEEKRERKAAVKEERKERRVEKKNTKIAFRQETTSQRKQQISMATNLQGHKIL